MVTSASRSRGARPPRSAFTLLELLVAMALTMLLVIAMAEFYTYVGDTVRDGRAIVEMGGDIRNAVRQLEEDLRSLTVRPVPPIRPDGAQGYLEIIEGIANDLDISGNGTAELAPAVSPLVAEGYDLNNDGVMDQGTMRGDTDDILAMTIRSSGVPFTGRRYNATLGGYETIQSSLAEVVWFTTFKDLNGDFGWQLNEPRFLVRRVLLIRPDLTGTLTTPALGAGENFFHHNDVSAHYDTANNAWVANSLSHLTLRENRFLHHNLQQLARNGLRAGETTMTHPNPNTAAYMPNPLWMMVNLSDPANQMSVYQYTLQRTQTPGGDFAGEDLILPNLLAFDLRVYDPTVPLYGDTANVNNALAALQPGDPGYSTAYNLNPANPVGYGAYVDLFYRRHPSNSALPATNFSTFSDAPHDRSNSYFPDPSLSVNLPLAERFIANYDTWTTYYERDGFDQYANSFIDRGTDGIDNDGANGVDDAGEYETSPPYLTPLQGLQVRIRMYEPGTRQTRQATIVQDF